MLSNKYVKRGSLLIAAALLTKQSIFLVKDGECALVMDTVVGNKPRVCSEGYHYALPGFHKVFWFDL